MKEYSVRLNESEFKLFKLIQGVNIYPDIKNDLLESLMKQVKNFSQLTSPKKTQKWLQVGDRTLFENIAPIRLEANSPLASDIIKEQRKRINIEE
ncbi:hypothetical protein [Candidatus Parabeggiatoa sp. HSG14]|uniref:hypothetical protein n=1 Tax=Candidatus Parabeggiatoa sp. HSG14 TaxID=3055593 RepID=UPI0025A6EB01|nr:hypothetical protein [Thiotrichales bacterium HSG14]